MRNAGCGVQVMEDGSIGVRTLLQLMCCTLAEEQGYPQFQRRQAGETQGERERLVGD